MPRDLADVLHYFLPELDDVKPASAGTSTALDSKTPGSEPPHSPMRHSSRRLTHDPDSASTPTRPRPEADTALLPILGLPIGDRDVVRAALAWNLAVETSRLGGSSLLLAPESDRGSPLWPEPGVGPLGCELQFCDARDLKALYATATERATQRGATASRGGIVFVRVPPAWLTDTAMPRDLVSWLLLLTTSNPRDLGEALEVAEAIAKIHSRVEIGVTVQGVQTIAEARSAFESIARSAKDRLGLELISYGLLVDDLNVYRAIAAQQPIGLAHPQAPASRALMDVARLLYEDARSRVLG